MKNAKKLPLYAVLLIDLAAALVIAGLLLVYFVFLPKQAIGQMLPVSGEELFFPLPGGDDRALEDLVLKGKKGQVERKALFTFSDEEKRVVVTENTLGEKDAAITWYSADIFVVSIKVLRAHVSADDTGTVINRSVKSQSKACSALLAVTGDTFGMSKDGVIVRNGLLYRNDVRTFNDVCVLSLDGTMKIFKRSDLYSISDIQAAGAWQVFTFGPSLLNANGEPNKTFNIAASHLSDLSYEHPRTAIGMVSPGHFVFTVVDGRGDTSKGATFPELAKIMQNEGCAVAYNLDGGRSAVMTWRDAVVNKPYKNGRGISDILYVPLAPVLNEEEEGGAADNE